MSTPEPTLAKAADADVHPVVGAPIAARPPATTKPESAPAQARASALPTTDVDAGEADDRRVDGHEVAAKGMSARNANEADGRNTKAKRKSLKPGKGYATSDAILGATKDKLVDLGVRVPKSVRKRLKAEAKERGLSPDAIVTAILDAALDDRR